MQDESHFIRDFRKAYGMTPIRYRAFYLASDTAKVNQLTEAAKLANK